MSLIIDQVWKSYRQGENKISILKGCQATIKPAEVVAVLGQSGSGKSTLLALLAGMDQPDQGKIVIDETNLNALSEDQMTEFRGKNIGIVFQQFHLMNHLTALENVCLPLEILGRNDVKAAEKILNELGLGHRLNHFPSQLSGGECQRVAIARALVLQPKILLADEPSGNLDAETGRQVMDLLFEIVRKYRITTVLVTHNENLTEKCDRTLVLKNGLL